MIDAGLELPSLLDEEVAFDRDLHAYRDTNGSLCMSVTQAITISGLVDYSRVPEPIMTIAKERGILVHLATAVIDRGDPLDDYILPAEIEPYVEGYHAFLREMKFYPDPEWVEKRMIVSMFGHRVGMTPDVVGKIDGVPTLIERKTTASRHPAWAIQTAGYTEGLRSFGLQIRQRFALRLLKTGYYDLVPHEDEGDFSSFGDVFRFACLKLKYRLASL